MKGSATTQDPLLGQTLGGSYRITRLLGSGGMGKVYEAVHLATNARVAVKVLLPGAALDPTTYARFRREAAIGAQLGHTHIVQVLDFNVTEDGRPYLVMELLEGCDLQQRIAASGRMSTAEVRALVEQVGSALSAAHQLGVVHRDLKPENVFLVKPEAGPLTVKLLDFGLCKIKSAASALTHASMLMGTPCYMSPEQADGLTTEVDHVSDVFALGTIAYVCLTGAQPFDGPSVPATLYNVCHLRPRPARELLPALPAAVDAVLERAMAKRKVDRYQDVAEFVDDLRRALAGLPLRRLPQEERTQPVERVGEGLARARTAPSRRAEGAAAEEARTPRLEALQAIPTGPQTPRIEPATPPLEPGGNGRRGHPEPTTPPFEAESPREDSPLPEMIPDEDFTRERSQAAPPRSAHLRAIVIAVGLLVAAGAATAAYFVADPGGPTTAAPIAASERVLASPAPDAGRPGALDLARHESPPPDVSVVDLRPPVAEGDDDDDSQAGRRTSSRVKRTKQTKGTKPVKPGRQKKTPSAGEPQPQPKAKPAVPADDLYTDP